MSLKTYISILSERKYQWLNFKCWWHYHKFAIIIFSLIIGGVLFICFQSKLLSICPVLDSIFKDKDGFSNIVSVLAAIISASVAYSNYNIGLKMKTLSSYNERFCKDKCIKKVTKELAHKISDRETSNDSDHSSVAVDLSYDEEIFYRFFEELELNIEKGILKRKDVYNLFAYYALEGINNHRLYPKDYPENWRLLEKFIKCMKPYTTTNGST